MLCDVQVLINPALFHGAILLDNTSKAALLVEVKALLDTSGSLVVRLARPVVDRTLSAARSIMLEVGDLTTRCEAICCVVQAISAPEVLLLVWTTCQDRCCCRLHSIWIMQVFEQQV